MSSTGPIFAPQPRPQRAYAFYNAATGASIKLQATSYLMALPRLLATANALTTQGLELLGDDKTARMLHAFVAEHGGAALDEIATDMTPGGLLADHGSGDDKDGLIARFLGRMLGVYTDMADVGQACMAALNDNLADALHDGYTEYFDYAAYAESVVNEGSIYLLHVHARILLFHI